MNNSDEISNSSRQQVIEIARRSVMNTPGEILSSYASYEIEKDVWLVIFSMDWDMCPSSIFVEVHDKTHVATRIPLL